MPYAESTGIHDLMPFDIETTGFKAADGDKVTVVVLHYNNHYQIWVNTHDVTDVDVESMTEEVKESSTLENITIHVHNTEKSLLENLGNFVSEHSTDDTLLTAFNGETYKGGFDLSFLRTRCLRNGVPWIFSGMEYTDSYDNVAQNGRFDTTIRAEPSLDNLERNDLEQFIDTSPWDVDYSRMKKKQVVEALNNHNDINLESVQSWAESDNSTGAPLQIGDFNAGTLKAFARSFEKTPSPLSPKTELIVTLKNGWEYVVESEDEDEAEETIQIPGQTVEDVIDWVDNQDNRSGFSNFKTDDLRDFIDDKGYNISHNKLSSDEIVSRIRDTDYTQEDLINWHERTNRSIGTTTVSDLDGMHEVLIEDLVDDQDWKNSLPFPVEAFEPFDPFVDSGEAVQAYANHNYSDVVLHCLADVARTVNISRMIIEYVSTSDYQTKIL